MKAITTIISSAFCLMLMSCIATKTIERKELCVYNISKQAVILHDFSSVDLSGAYGHKVITRMYGAQGKNTPREYDSGYSVSLNIWSDIVNIQYPIIAKWAYQSRPKEIKETRFVQIMNLKKAQKEIRDAGSINLIFYDGAFYLIWVKHKHCLGSNDFLEILKNIKK